MNPFKVFTEEELELITNVTKIEDRDYSKAETKIIESYLLEDITFKSTKNGDMDRSMLEYSDILDKLERRLK